MLRFTRSILPSLCVCPYTSCVNPDSEMRIAEGRAAITASRFFTLFKLLLNPHGKPAARTWETNAGNSGCRNGSVQLYRYTISTENSRRAFSKIRVNTSNDISPDGFGPTFPTGQEGQRRLHVPTMSTFR